MEEQEKIKLDKKIKISKILLLINFIISLVSICINNKVIKYIYYFSILLLMTGITLLIIVITKRYKKDTTYSLSLLYLADIFIQFMGIVLKLDSCQDGL